MKIIAVMLEWPVCIVFGKDLMIDLAVTLTPMPLSRIFVHLIENSKLELGGSNNSTTGKANQWVISQYQSYQTLLCTLACSTVEWMWELCIKTDLEV